MVRCPHHLQVASPPHICLGGGGHQQVRVPYYECLQAREKARIKFFAPYRLLVQKIQISLIMQNSGQVSPPPANRVTTPSTFTQCRKIWGKTINQPLRWPQTSHQIWPVKNQKYSLWLTMCIKKEAYNWNWYLYVSEFLICFGKHFATIICQETELKSTRIYNVTIFRKSLQIVIVILFCESANIFIHILCDVLPNLCTCIAEFFLVARCYEVQTFWYLAKIHLI